MKNAALLALLAAAVICAAGCRRGSGAQTAPGAEAPAYRTWEGYGGGPGFTHYSALDQINRSNVGQLEVAWTYHTGDEGPTIECNPIVIDGVMYITSPALKVIALDAATGEELWRFDPFDGREMVYWHNVNRGVSYWESEDGRDRRVFMVAEPHLYALDAETGRLIQDFGTNGAVDLRDALDRDAEGVRVTATSPGVVYKDLIIIGPSVGEGVKDAPGPVLAYNVKTGALEWAFHTIPKPGQFGNDTWEGDSWRFSGGANPWGGLSLDTERGLVFVATGSTAYDFYGGHRAGKNLFSNTLVALDAETGERVWHFQIGHHDLWDYDLPAPPSLVTVSHGGERVDAVAQVTKTGYVYLFDRATGEPLFPIEERPVPPSTVPGEEAWPTQPVPTKPPPFALQDFSAEDVITLFPESRAAVLERLDTLRHGQTFTPGSRQGTVVLPGYLGGANWSGAAVDPATGMLYVNGNNLPYVLTMVEAPDSLEAIPGAPDYVATGYNLFLGPEGYPAVKPPWGTLTAIDLGESAIAWQVPLGEFAELTARGVPPTGTPNLGGAIVTAGGLVFIGSTMDKKFRAFDKATGEVLWETTLPTGGMAMPATYEVDGTQYVVIAAGGGFGYRGSLPYETKPGDTYVAFALP